LKHETRNLELTKNHLTKFLTDPEILAFRGQKNTVDPRRPYAFLNEPEFTPSGAVKEISTLFLTNRECPFRCLMCDLWKNTTDTSVAPGDIPAQISFALRQLPPASQIKLYNSGNFFDRKAIPREDYPAIAALLAPYERVIVENHPRLCNADCIQFERMIRGRLEVAMGLETVHPEVLPRLNKRMTLDDFEQATTFLLANDIDVRAFILLKPPYMDEQESIQWALESIDFAFRIGVHCCTVIPTRPGNGAVDYLKKAGYFEKPALSSIERALEAGLELNKGRVFMDLWDLEQFYGCPDCGPLRKHRLQRMNLTQQLLPPVVCSCS